MPYFLNNKVDHYQIPATDDVDYVLLIRRCFINNTHRILFQYCSDCNRVDMSASTYGKHWQLSNLLLAYELSRCWSLGPNLLTWFNFEPSMESNYTHYNVRGEITYPFLYFNGATVEDYEWISNFTPHFIKHVITYPCWDLS